MTSRNYCKFCNESKENGFTDIVVRVGGNDKNYSKCTNCGNYRTNWKLIPRSNISEALKAINLLRKKNIVKKLFTKTEIMDGDEYLILKNKQILKLH